MTKRKECGLSQETLAEIIGYSKNHLSSVERGKYTPTTNFIIAICNALGETPDYYLIGTPTKYFNSYHNIVFAGRGRYSRPLSLHNIGIGWRYLFNYHNARKSLRTSPNY